MTSTTPASLGWVVTTSAACRMAGMSLPTATEHPHNLRQRASFSASPMPTTLWAEIRNSSRATVRPVFLSNPLASDREKCSLKSSGGGDVPATAPTHTASTRRWSAQLFSQDSIHFRDDAVESLERFAVHHPDGKWKLKPGYAERAQARPHSAACQNPPRDKCQSTIFSHKGKLELVVVRFHRNYHIEVGLQK